MTGYRGGTRQPYVPTPKRLQQQAEIAKFGARILGSPQPGFFKVKLVKGGVFVAARITRGPTIDPETGAELDRSPFYAGEINGVTDPDPRPEPSAAVWRIWESGERIDEDEYRHLLATSQWAADHAPHLPIANPRRPIDLATLDPRLLL